MAAFYWGSLLVLELGCSLGSAAFCNDVVAGVYSRWQINSITVCRSEHVHVVDCLQFASARCINPTHEVARRAGMAQLVHNLPLRA